MGSEAGEVARGQIKVMHGLILKSLKDFKEGGDLAGGRVPASLIAPGPSWSDLRVSLSIWEQW